MLKKIFLLLFLFFLGSCLAFAQSDTAQTRGTIKITKRRETKMYIKAAMDFNNYAIPKSDVDPSNYKKYPPFPKVDGYVSPFNYTKYITEKFKTKEIDLRGKVCDTVRIEVIVHANGKVYLKNMGRANTAEPLTSEWSSLQLYSFNFLKEINTWEPGYIEIPKKDKFKGQTVIKPKTTKVTSIGILTIMFSSATVED